MCSRTAASASAGSSPRTAARTPGCPSGPRRSTTLAAARPGTACWRIRGRGARRVVRRSGGTSHRCSPLRPGMAGSISEFLVRGEPALPDQGGRGYLQVHRAEQRSCATPPARRSSCAAGSRSARRSGAAELLDHRLQQAGPTAPEGGDTRRAPASTGPRPAGGRSKPARSGAGGQRPVPVLSLCLGPGLGGQPPRRSRPGPACTRPGSSAVRAVGEFPAGGGARGPPDANDACHCAIHWAWIAVLGHSTPWAALAGAPPPARSGSSRHQVAQPGK